MENIKVTHIGEDYGTVEVNGEEFECSLGLAEAIFKVTGENIKIHHHSTITMQELGSIIEREGKTYKVTNNEVIYQTTATLVE